MVFDHETDIPISLQQKQEIQQRLIKALQTPNSLNSPVIVALDNDSPLSIHLLLDFLDSFLFALPFFVSYVSLTKNSQRSCSIRTRESLCTHRSRS